MNKLRTVRLYGKLRGIFGKEFQFHVSSPAEAIRALCFQLEGFKEYLTNSHQFGIKYCIIVGNRQLNIEDIHLPSGSETIKIVPIIQGSKNAGLFQVVLGAVIVVASIVSYQWYGVGYGAAMMGGTLGASLMLGGAMQMMTNQPKGLGVQEESDQKKSYIFGGQQNTPAMGQPVPLIYGSPWSVPLVISSSIFAEDYR